MKKCGLHDWGTKDEQARRNSTRVGRGNNGSDDPQLLGRIAQRERADEAWARSLGVSLRYEDIRR